MKTQHFLKFLATTVLALGGVTLGSVLPASAAAQLTITPITWNIIGLDSNNVNVGPNTFLVGARVCNVGGTAATNVTASLVRDGATNQYISFSGNTTLTIPSLPAGSAPPSQYTINSTPTNCFDFYYNGVITRNSAAYNTTQGYHITATADLTTSVSTPTPRELYIEKLISQNRNAVYSLTGQTSVIVGRTYQYSFSGKTATGGYEQLEHFPSFPNTVFQLVGVSSTYANPTGAINSTIYADACGWTNDPSSTYYHSNTECTDPNAPDNYGSGTGAKVGGDPINTTYTVKILSAGSAQLNNIIYDYSGSSYHYNSDFSTGGVLSVTARNPVPKIGVAKAAGTLVNNNNGTYTVPFTVTVQNYGEEALKNVQVTENLLTSFTGATNISVTTPVVTVTNAGTDTPATNLASAGTTFTGQGGTANTGGANNLLAGGANRTLAVGSQATIKFNVTFKPGTNNSTFNNTVVATGTGNVTNTNVTDDSTDGTNPDNAVGGGTSNGDNNPTNNTSPTPINFPRLGVAKTITSSVKQANGSYNITYSVKLKNYGSESLTGVQVTDDLLSTFNPIAATNITIVTAPSVTVVNAGTPTPSATTLTANTNFTGKGGATNTNGVNNLLSGTTNVLAKGAEANITFTINVQPGTVTGTFNNTANGTGTGAVTTAATNDASQDGTDPDNTSGGLAANNGDGYPGNNSYPTVFIVAGSPNLVLVKRITAVDSTTYTTFKDDPTNQNDNNGNWPSGTIVGEYIAPDKAKPGSTVEYTIYFLSTGGSNAQNASICDLIPANTTFAPDSFATGKGIRQALGATNTDLTNAADTDSGQFYSATATPPASCRIGQTLTNGNGTFTPTNVGGAVVVNLGTVSTKANDVNKYYGYVKFRAKVN